jgi:trk system potassium uptake protein TrkH
MDALQRPVTSFMHENFLFVDGMTNVAEAVKSMYLKRVETIVVTLEGNAVGIVTDSDILEKIVIKGEDSDQIALKEIMTFPIKFLNASATVKEALEVMKFSQIKRLPIVDNSSNSAIASDSKDANTHDGKIKIIGIITQKAIADSVRTTVLENTFRKYRSSIRDRYKPILGNLGFVMQFAGVLVIVPALIGTFNGESESAVGMYLAVVGMFTLGFILTSYGDRGPLSLKEASILVVSSFILLSLFGSIPYIFINPFGTNISNAPLSLFVNSFFESASGFTTTGLSILSTPETLPQSFVFYRSYTQWIGGLSFIYLIVGLFYPEKKLKTMKGAIGGNISIFEYKHLITTVVVIFSVYVAILFAILFALEKDIGPIVDISLISSAITSGGFTPDSRVITGGNVLHLLVLGAGMIASALPFAFHYSLFNKKMRLKSIGLEVIAYGSLLVGSVLVFIHISGINDWLTAAFHVISASTTTGFQFIDLSLLAPEAKVFLIVLMLIGGTAFSTAGGIKIGRLLFVFQRMTKRSVPIETPASVTSRIGGRAYGESESVANRKVRKESDKLLQESLLVIGLFPAIAILTGFVLGYLNNYDLLDAIFESTSSLTNTGLSTGLVTIDLNLLSKLILVANMIVGRFEIIAILYIFFFSLRRI